jgi:hypothetical protein
VVGTQVRLDPALPERIHHCSWLAVDDAVQIFRDSELLVIDDVPWQADLGVIQRGLEPKRRGFKQPFHGAIAPEVSAELERLGVQVDALVDRLYPELVRVERNGSFRPMISGPEPLHFDTYAAAHSVLTSFVNVSAVPRRYCIARSLRGLVDDQPEVIQQVIAECKGNLDDLSFRIRVRTMRGRPPLGEPKHHVDFAPGAIWFFNAKTVSHELVYGEGAMGFSWEVPGGAPTQRDLVGGLLL